MNLSKWQRWLVLAVLAAAVWWAPVSSLAAAPAERVFRIQASQFQYLPAELQVNPGDHVTIELVATDVVHGLSIDGYNLQTSADPGQTARLSFTSSQEGTFRFRCTVTCGSLHPFMIGKLHVGQNNLLWRAAALAGLALLGSAWLAAGYRGKP